MARGPRSPVPLRVPAKIKDLNLQIEKLTSLTHERRLNLEQEVTETQAKQIELDKAAEEFRQIHKERQEVRGQRGTPTSPSHALTGPVPPPAAGQPVAGGHRDHAAP